MTTESELVSVVIPTYYRNERLRDALESVLNQEYEPVEVIVVDDSGERFAKPVADEYDVTYLPHDKNEGGNPSRNTGIEHASGAYIQLLDDDDRLAEQKLSRQVAVFQQSDEIGVVYCGVTHEALGGIVPDPNVRGHVLEHALTFGMFPCSTSTMLIRSEVLEQICPLKSRPSADDLGMMIELARLARFEYVDAPLVTKGSLEESRGQGLVNAEERLNIINEYDHLYDEFPERLRQMVLSKVYRQIGSTILNERTWSPWAISAYCKAVYYHPDPDFRLVVECLVSALGSPGRRAARSVKQKFDN